MIDEIQKCPALMDEVHLRGLKALQEEGTIRRAIVVCREDRPRRTGGIDILPWELFLDQLWGTGL